MLDGAVSRPDILHPFLDIMDLMLLLLLFKGISGASVFEVVPAPFLYITLNTTDVESLLGSNESECQDRDGSVESCQALCMIHEQCITFVYDHNDSCSCRFTSLPFCVFHSPFESYIDTTSFQSQGSRELLMGIHQNRSFSTRLNGSVSYVGYAPVFKNGALPIPIIQLIQDPSGRLMHFSSVNGSLQRYSTIESCETFCHESMSRFSSECKFIYEINRQVGLETFQICYLYDNNSLLLLETLQMMNLTDRSNDRSISSRVVFMSGAWNESQNHCEKSEWTSSLLSQEETLSKFPPRRTSLISDQTDQNLTSEVIYSPNVDEPNVLSDSYYPLNSLGLVHQILALVAIFVFLAFSIGLCIFFCPYIAARRTHRNRHRPQHVHYSQADPLSQSMRPYNHSQWGQHSMASSFKGHNKSQLASSMPSIANSEKRMDGSLSDRPEVVVVSLPNSQR